MSIKLEITPALKVIEEYFFDLPKKVQNEARDEMAVIANDMRNNIVTAMIRTEKKSTGYRRGNKTHFPSAPGNAPATDSGTLIGSFEMDVKLGGAKIEVGTNVLYAKFLEAPKDKRKARPIIENMVQGIDVEDRIATAIQRGFAR
jgi:hypothetical protein